MNALMRALLHSARSGAWSVEFAYVAATSAGTNHSGTAVGDAWAPSMYSKAT